jgi:hypothetical protein
MFVSALYRYQIHLVDNLMFFPVSMKTPIGNTHGIEEFIKGNKLVYEGREVSLTLGKIDSVEYKFEP